MRTRYRPFLAAYVASLLGTAVATGVNVWLAVAFLGASATEVAVLLGVAALVGSLVGIFGSARLSRFPARTLLIALDLIVAGTLVILAVCVFVGVLTLPMLVVAGTIEQVCTILFAGASASVLKEVAGDQLDQVNGQMEAYFWTLQALGPVLGGVLTHSFGPGWAISVNAVSFVVSAACLRHVDGGKLGVRASGSRPELAGVRVIWQTRLLRRLFVNAVIFTCAVLGVGALFPVFMRNELGFDAWQFGLVQGVPCVGGFLAGLWSARLVAKFGRHRLLVASGFARTVWLLPIAFIPVGVWAMPTIFVLDFLLLFCAGLFNPVYSTTRIRVTPPEHVAAVVSTWGAINRGIAPLAMLSLGMFADGFGVRSAFVLAGVLSLASALLLIRLPQVPESVVATEPATESQPV